MDQRIVFGIRIKLYPNLIVSRFLRNYIYIFTDCIHKSIRIKRKNIYFFSPAPFLRN